MEEDKVRLQRELCVLTVNLDTKKEKMKKCLGHENVMNSQPGCQERKMKKCFRTRECNEQSTWLPRKEK